MPYFRDFFIDLGQDNLTLNPEPIPGYVVNYGTVGNFTYLEMSTGLIYVRSHDCNLKTHIGWTYLHESCVDEVFPKRQTYTMFELECMSLITLQNKVSLPDGADRKVFKEAYTQLFIKYQQALLHKEYFINGTKENGTKEMSSA